MAYLCNSGISESGSEEGDVGGLIVGDLLEVGIEGGVKSSFGKVCLGVVGETFAVEFVLEVLESESIVQDANYVWM